MKTNEDLENHWLSTSFEDLKSQLEVSYTEEEWPTLVEFSSNNTYLLDVNMVTNKRTEKTATYDVEKLLLELKKLSTTYK